MIVASEHLTSCDYCGDFRECRWMWDGPQDEERVACDPCVVIHELHPLSVRHLAS